MVQSLLQLGGHLGSDVHRCRLMVWLFLHLGDLLLSTQPEYCELSVWAAE